MQQYYSEIQNRICQDCVYAILGHDQQFLFCGLPEGRQCTIERFLPEVIGVVNSFDVLSLKNQIIEIRCKVCCKCDLFGYGSCPLTGIGECTLDARFPEIAKLIKGACMRTA